MDHTSSQTERIDASPHDNPASDKAISRAIGKELREAREALDLSRGQLVACLPSRIGDRTLLSYEHGTRHLTVLRLIEIARAVGIPAPTLLSLALQKATVELANLVLQVDLKALLNDRSAKYRPMIQWARNKLNTNPDGIVKLSPSSVKELATFAGYSYRELANHLAKFAPEREPSDDTDSMNYTDEAYE